MKTFFGSIDPRHCHHMQQEAVAVQGEFPDAQEDARVYGKCHWIRESGARSIGGLQIHKGAFLNHRDISSIPTVGRQYTTNHCSKAGRSLSEGQDERNWGFPKAQRGVL